DLETMSQIYGVQYHPEQRRAKRKLSGEADDRQPVGDDHIELPVVFEKGLFSQDMLPKCVLNRWVMQQGDIERPQYWTREVDRQYHTVARFCGQLYSSRYL